MEQAPLPIAIAGLGTVGAGVLSLLERQTQLLASRCGRCLKVVAVSARDRRKNRGVNLSGVEWFDDPVAMAENADAEIYVELIGGADGVAMESVCAALAGKRHVVTANKAMIAHHGTGLARLAAENDRTLAYEAAVAGGMPIIKSVREGMTANRISRIYGILNGTCNFILSTMRDSGIDFAEALAQAQEMGIAEADPGFDIDGVDAAHKLSILAALAFGSEVRFDGVHVEGIRNVSAFDINSAEELGFRIKLLGIASLVEGRLEQRVHPCMVPRDRPIAAVEGVLNAVVAEGDHSGAIMVEGAGAGAGPTASAVVADIVDIARGNFLPAFTVPAKELADREPRPMAYHRGCYYLRLTVRDQPGVIAEVAAALRDESISMEAMLQHGRADGEGAPVPVVITTHETEEAAMRRALTTIAGCEPVLEPPCVIRIETL